MLFAGEDGLFFAVFQGILVNDVDHVTTETCYALVQPKTHDVLDLFHNVGIVPVEIWLLFGEQMEIIFVLALAKLFPRAFGKEVAPVVGKLAVFPLLDNVVVAVFFLSGQRTAEPLVLVGGVVDHQIHDDVDAALLGFGNQLVEILHSAEFGLNRFVVGNIVAVVIVGTLINRGKPNGVDAKIGDIVKFFDNAPKVAYAVVGGVLEGTGIDLIDDGVFGNIALHHLPPDGWDSYL